MALMHRDIHCPQTTHKGVGISQTGGCEIFTRLINTEQGAKTNFNRAVRSPSLVACMVEWSITQ